MLRVLVGVGLGSVPSWLKPYAVLSGGERFRADLARALLSAARPIVVIDEFTSSLDRTIARTTAAAVARLVRRGLRGEGPEVGGQKSDGKATRLVAVTCHSDILPWLAPDWVLDLGAGDVPRLTTNHSKHPSCRSLCGACHRLWEMFARHHYLTGGLAASATCYGAWVGIAECGFRIAEWRAASCVLCCGGVVGVDASICDC
jgi:hypothetical protein